MARRPRPGELGIDKNTLRRKINRYGLTPPAKVRDSNKVSVFGKINPSHPANLREQFETLKNLIWVHIVSISPSSPSLFLFPSRPLIPAIPFGTLFDGERRRKLIFFQRSGLIDEHLSEPPRGPSAGDKHHQQKQGKTIPVLRTSSATSGTKLLVMSGKGGVGKTSVAVYLSLGLAQKRLSGRIAAPTWTCTVRMFPACWGSSGEFGMDAQGHLVPQRYSDHLQAVSIECLLHDRDEAVIWRGPLKHSYIQQSMSPGELGQSGLPGH